LTSEVAISVTPLEACCRLAFRGGREAADLAGDAFEVPLPGQPCRAAHNGERAALWLGRDEWLLLAPPGEAQALVHSITLALRAKPHALVDVSDRSLALLIEGSSAAEALATGCPLDLDIEAFPVNMCTRTLYGKAEIVLWRKQLGQFRVDVWRSYLPYVTGLIAEAVRDQGVVERGSRQVPGQPCRAGTPCPR
jgi:sarcosine oxidase subunit gamma